MLNEMTEASGQQKKRVLYMLDREWSAALGVTWRVMS